MGRPWEIANPVKFRRQGSRWRSACPPAASWRNALNALDVKTGRAAGNHWVPGLKELRTEVTLPPQSAVTWRHACEAAAGCAGRTGQVAILADFQGLAGNNEDYAQ